MRKLKLIVILLTFLTYSYARDAPQRFFQTTEIDVGKVPILQESVVVKFKYFNQTGNMVVIQKVHPSCGCTDVVYPKRPIRHKEKGTITATVRLSKSENHFNTSILICANGLKPIILRIKGKR